MRDLVEHYESLSTHAQELMSSVIDLVQRRIAPSEGLCEEVNESLVSLRNSYLQIKSAVAEYVPAEDMPDEDVSITEYETLYRNSESRRRLEAISATLRTFIHVYSDETRYMDALKPSIETASQLLEQMQADEPDRTADIAKYQVFINKVIRDDEWSEEEENLLIDGFDAKVVLGLERHKYAIREIETDNEAIPLNEPDRSNEVAAASDVPSCTSEAEKPEPVKESQADDEAGKTAVDDMEAEAAVEDESPVQETAQPEDFIQPAVYREQSKLPSEQKLAEAFRHGGDLFHFLIRYLAFCGLLDYDVIYKLWSKEDSTEHIDKEIAYLADKGYICIYNFETRRVISFTQYMKNCFAKQRLANYIKRRTNIKRLGKVTFIGKENTPLDSFMRTLSGSDMYNALTELLDENVFFAKLLPTAIHDENSDFSVKLVRDGFKDKLLHIVSAEHCSDSIPDSEDGVLFCSENLPELADVSDDAHFCLNKTALYQWNGHEWIALTPTDNDTDPTDRPKDEDTMTEESEKASDVETKVDQGISTDNEDTAGTTITDEGNVQEEFCKDNVHAPDAEYDPEVSDTKGADYCEEPDTSPVTTATAEESTVPITKATVANELWLDDIADEKQVQEENTEELAGLNAQEIAALLNSHAVSGSTPTDSQMLYLMKQLLTEGVVTYECSNMRDQIVEAVVLARILYEDEHYKNIKAYCGQLLAAIPMISGYNGHSGDHLIHVFSQETDYTPAAKLCAYIYGMVFPTRSYDYTFASLYKSAFDSFDTQFEGFTVLKPLYHRVMGMLSEIPDGFSAANLAVLKDSNSYEKSMERLQSRAKACLRIPSIKMMVNGIPELLEKCFGSQSTFYSIMEIIHDNQIDLRTIVEEEYQRYCNKIGEIDETVIEQVIDSAWNEAAAKYSSRRMGIKYAARDIVVKAFEERLSIMMEWLDLTNCDARPDVETLEKQRQGILSVLFNTLKQMPSISDGVFRNIISASLQIIADRLQDAPLHCDFSTLLRSSEIIVDNGELTLNDGLNKVHFAEQWRSMLRHIACDQYDLNMVYEELLSADVDSSKYDNFWQLSAIGRMLGRAPEEYEVSGDAVASADNEKTKFRGKLEISYAYNRISEIDRERLAMLVDSDIKAFYYAHNAFGCWRGFLDALKAQIKETSKYRMFIVRSELDKAKLKLASNETSELLTEAERFITEDKNYAVAEEYIHRFLNGEKSLPLETAEGTSTSKHFQSFISADVYGKLNAICDRNKELALSNFGVKYIQNHPPKGWTTRNIEDAIKFLAKWPTRKGAASETGIQTLFAQLGFNVESAQKSNRGNEDCFVLTVKRAEQNLADYSHPIAAFGTQMKQQIDVVCLFGNRTAKQFIDDVCKLGLTGPFFVLLDATMSLSDRRTMAEYFFTQKNVGQASFLVIDRILALYLALQTYSERLPAMLQCTLPFTIYQPFTNGSGSAADEMFSGRVSELASIRDMNGVSVVYGGRQLGKTALLQRVKNLDNAPNRLEFAIYASFKDQRGEENFVRTLTDACNETFQKAGLTVKSCGTIKEFIDQIKRYIDDDRISILRLLLDETDAFLDSISDSKYSELQPMVEFQRNSNRRFKFVLAGLHNVCRAKNATKNNGIYGQLGASLCVKPLTPSDAKNLLVRPLRYLGFKVTNESHIETILTNSNYYPGIIQYFGYTLVQTLVSQYSQYYQASRDNPPYELHDEQLASIMNSRDLNHNIKERLRWTLEMDERYFMLARCIAWLYLYHDSDIDKISSGFDIEEIKEVADLNGILCLDELREQEYSVLLDEMEEMGILSKPNSSGNKYLLRRRSFIDVIGSNTDELEKAMASESEGNDLDE